VTPSWQTQRITERGAAAHFDGVGNIGVILGEASGGLVDIDLDCSEAIELAPEHLPTTEAIFGRQGKPRSHWLYRVNGNAPTLQIRDPLTREMLLELRGDGGHQTIFPGSVNESGELIEWALEGEPTTIEYNTLCEAVKRIAALCLVKRYCPEVTDRPSLLAALSRIDVRVANKLRQLCDLPAASMPSQRPSEAGAATLCGPRASAGLFAGPPQAKSCSGPSASMGARRFEGLRL
jgi:hypothetical protein